MDRLAAPQPPRHHVAFMATESIDNNEEEAQNFNQNIDIPSDPAMYVGFQEVVSR